MQSNILLSKIDSLSIVLLCTSGLYELGCNSVVCISELQQLCNMVEGREDDFIPHDCIRIGNKLYNGKKLESWHPGGRLFIQGQ